MFKKVLDVMRMKCVGFPAGQGWIDVVRAGLEGKAFVDNGISPKEVICGWTRASDLGSTDFSESFVSGQYAFFGYRSDRRRLPKNLFKAELRKRISTWCKERGLERAASAVRVQLKEDLESEWCRRILPVANHVIVVVDTETSDAWVVGSINEENLEKLRQVFYASFNAKLIPISAAPDIVLGTQRFKDLCGYAPLKILPPIAFGKSVSKGGIFPVSLMEEFFLWIWMVSDTGGTLRFERARPGDSPGAVDLHCDGQIRLQSDTGKSSFQADHFANDAREALRTGKVPVSMRFLLKDGELTYKWVLGTDPYAYKLGLPEIDFEDSSDEATVFGTIASVRAAEELFDRILDEYLGRRVHDMNGLVDELREFANDTPAVVHEGSGEDGG